MILGIDEVGRGPWAGPLVVGAVVLGGAKIDGLTDSKKLTSSKREVLDKEIHEKAISIGLGWVSAAEIDEVGLSKALKLATIRAVEQISTPYHEIVIDGTVNFLAETSKGEYVTTMKKADLLVPSVSAASIVAKVARDKYMTEQDSIYPGYRFQRHVGYGTLEHRLAIEKLGVTRIHRLSFAPLNKYKTVETTRNIGSIKLSTKVIGDKAESVAANYLAKLGHTIIDRNWKTKYCEIDIVSSFNNVIYYTEVKYRRRLEQGGGVAAITRSKLKKMKFALKVYVMSNDIDDTDIRLAVVTLVGQPPVIENFLELD
jgi:ribonuclease HII